VRLRRPRRRARPAHPPASAVGQLARIRLEHWSAERSAIRNGKTTNFKSPGRPPHTPNTNRFDAALVRCIDFEREFSKLTGDEQTILLLGFREHQPHRVIAQIARRSERAVSYKIPAGLAQLARLLDRASML
jgi:DNA-directed RNA polymerase specialized sigma24 family protein